ncbi:unnamed protein product [Clonostachys rosea f. rosea IK726]|uniref:Uncharacterized protein n=1 Tax=Clonostachys rosea f. rosea IK726 TaxID=1349383 RepID=A0ACA9ULM1_BIOOC|nr:unnamed protein product [Clonostachys rosea f. rosea IK726]
MAAEEGGSGQVPPQPTIRRVFGMMKAYLNEFERQTLNGFKTLQEQYQEKDEEMSRSICNVMDSFNKNSSPGERQSIEEKLQSLLSQRWSFRAEHEANQVEEEEACEKRQMELLRPLQIALFHSFPAGSWDGMMLHGAENVQGGTGLEEQQPDEVIQHTAQETQREFETVNDVAIDGGSSAEDVNGGIHDEEPCDEVLGQIGHNAMAESNEVLPDALPSSRMNEIDAETTHHSLMEAEGSERSAIDIDSEFEPEADDDSEEVDDQSTLSATVDEEFLVLGRKRKLSYGSRLQPRKKPCRWKKAPTKNQSKERTIRYREVYDNTIAGHKETIVQYPANKGLWYIIRCEEHGLKFGGSNPLMDAAFHLGSLQHDKYSKAYKDVIDQMGIRVKYCTASRAEQNNNAFTKEGVQKNSPTSMDRTTGSKDEEKRGGQAFGSRKAALMSDKAETSRSSQGTEDHVYDDRGSKTSKYDDTNEANERLYVRRQPGDICLVYLGGEYIPVLVLPFDNMLEIGINGDLKTLNLVQFMPDCCIYDLATGKYRWKKGYEDGGAFESSRAHPGLCLTHNTLETCPPVWVKGTNLGNFDLMDPVIMKQEYYQPLLRLIQQADVNRSAILANVVTEPGSRQLMAKTLNPITYPSKGVMSKKDQTMASIAKQIEERIKTMTP